MDQAGGVRARGERGGGRPDERDRVVDHARIGRRDELPDQRRRPLAVLDGWPRPAPRAPRADRRGSPAWRRSSACRPAGGRTPRRRPSRGVDLELGQRGADAAEMVRRQPAIEEPAVEPAQEHARARLRDARLRRRTTSAPSRAATGAGTRSDVSRGQRGEPGHLRADGRRGWRSGRLMRSTCRVPPASTRNVTFCSWRSSVRRPSCRSPGIGGQRLRPEPPQPPELPATAQRVVRTHRAERTRPQAADRGRTAPGATHERGSDQHQRMNAARRRPSADDDRSAPLSRADAERHAQGASEPQATRERARPAISVAARGGATGASALVVPGTQAQRRSGRGSAARAQSL